MLIIFNVGYCYIVHWTHISKYIGYWTLNNIIIIIWWGGRCQAVYCGVHYVQVIIIVAFLILTVYANYLIMFLFICTKIVYKHVICNLELNHSTVLCTAIYIETINHNVNEGSNVYIIVVYLMQVKHLTDRVHWGRLFKNFIERKVSFLFIRLLLDSYLRQLSCVAWGLFKSRYFSLSNGVKQGGIYHQFSSLYTLINY